MNTKFAVISEDFRHLKSIFTVKYKKLTHVLNTQMNNKFAVISEDFRHPKSIFTVKYKKLTHLLNTQWTLSNK